MNSQQNQESESPSSGGSNLFREAGTFLQRIEDIQESHPDAIQELDSLAAEIQSQIGSIRTEIDQLDPKDRDVVVRFMMNRIERALEEILVEGETGGASGG